MKTVCIIAGDTVPFPLVKDAVLSKFDYNNFVNATNYGTRQWKLAEYLSKQDKVEVTLLVPDVYYPTELMAKHLIDKSKINFKIDTYNYKIASWGWSQELDRKLKKYNFVICPTYNGCGLENCSVLPGDVHVIVDGWSVLPLEYSARLLSHSKIARKVKWGNFIKVYSDLITRCNCLLYANDRQREFYEGLFFGVNKLNYNAFQFSPMLKVPFGVEKKEKIKKPDTGTKNVLKLLYEGPVAPWDYPELIFKKFYNHNNVFIDFVNLEHPRQNKIYNSYFKPFFETTDDVHNIELLSKNTIDKTEYDYQIVMSRNWVIDSYIHRPEILDSFASGLPIIVNKMDSLYSEIEFIRKSIAPIKSDNIDSTITNLFTHPHYIDDQQLQEFNKIFSWDNVLTPLFDYIDNFS
jgi:hypothetical protein